MKDEYQITQYSLPEIVTLCMKVTKTKKGNYIVVLRCLLRRPASERQLSDVVFDSVPPGAESHELKAGL